MVSLAGATRRARVLNFKLGFLRAWLWVGVGLRLRRVILWRLLLFLMILCLMVGRTMPEWIDLDMDFVHPQMPVDNT